MPDNPLVYVIILNYKRRDDTLECVESVLASDYGNLRALVVDNASGDGTPESVREKFPAAELVVNDTNLMYAGGNNVGIRYALEHGADYLLLLNNDTVIQPTMISRLVEAMGSNSNAGLCCPMIYYHGQAAGGSERIWYAGGIVDLWTGLVAHRGIREYDVGRYANAEDTGYITGCAMMASRACVERTGSLDESYGMYSEDLDYSLRAVAAGYRLVFVPEARMWHKVSASVGGEFSFAKLKMKLRSITRAFYRHASPMQKLTLTVAFPLRILYQVVTRLLINTRGNMI
jgi:hypothetical protein